MSVVRLSLISHTNVGKTTLARTLLKRDVGDVRDAAHVTELAERYVLIETPEGDVLELWDTPGFGDSARLLRRLRQSGNPFGWFLSQVWDRYTDRPFFSSQQAMRNVRDTADVVLYLVNASEDPAAAGYVAPEMEILGWSGKPVLVLLNQLGPPRIGVFGGNGLGFFLYDIPYLGFRGQQVLQFGDEGPDLREFGLDLLCLQGSEFP